MTHEQRINKEYGDCNYKEITSFHRITAWERACGDNNIDFVIGFKYPKGQTPIAEDFNYIPKAKCALRFEERSDAEEFFFLKTGQKF